MRKQTKFTLLLLTTALFLTIASCKDAATTADSGSGGGSIKGDTITSGATADYPQEYVTNPDEAKTYTDFSFAGGGHPLSEFINPPASVTVKDGKVTINLGTPIELFLLSEDFLDSSITVTPQEAKVSDSSYFYTSDDKYFLVCMKDEHNEAILVYADMNVTVKGTDTETDEEEGVTYTEKWDASLKKGWNYLTRTRSGNTTTFSSSVTIPTGYKWTIGEMDSH